MGEKKKEKKDKEKEKEKEKEEKATVRSAPDGSDNHDNHVQPGRLCYGEKQSL